MKSFGITALFCRVCGKRALRPTQRYWWVPRSSVRSGGSLHVCCSLAPKIAAAAAKRQFFSENLDLSEGTMSEQLYGETSSIHGLASNFV